MSNVKFSVFHNVTGKFIVYGNEKSNAVRDAMAQGHTRIDGEYDNGYMLVNGVVVVDPDKVQKEQDKETRRQGYKDAKAVITATTGGFKQGNSLDADAVNDFLIEVQKMVANS